MKPLDERQKDFKQRIWESVGKTFDEYPKLMLADFFSYWSEYNEPITSNTKMRFEKEKTFNLKRRLATWKKNTETRFGRFKATKDMDSIRYPNYLNKSLMNRLTGQKWQEYKEHLLRCGYKYQPGINGQQAFFISPKNERIWI